MASLRSICNPVIFSIARGICNPLPLDDCTMKKIQDFNAWVLIDVDLLFSLLQQLFMQRLGFASVAMLNMNVFHLFSFFFFL